MEALINNLSKLMADNGISAHKLEVTLGFSNSTISTWKSGKFRPSLDALIKIADYFNVSLDYLVGRSVSEDETLSEERQALLKEARSIPEGQVPLLLAVIKQFNNR